MLTYVPFLTLTFDQNTNREFALWHRYNVKYAGYNLTFDLKVWDINNKNYFEEENNRRRIWVSEMRIKQKLKKLNTCGLCTSEKTTK